MATKRLPRLVGEFVLIVAGVLVALAVDSWSQERADREVVASYLSSLERELVQDTALNRIFLAVGRERERAITQLLDDLNGRLPRLEDRPALLGLWSASPTAVPLYVTSMLDELRSTGNARLLDLAVLEALQGFASRLQITADVIDELSFPMSEVVSDHVPGAWLLTLRDCSRSCTSAQWVWDAGHLNAVADSLLTAASGSELERLRAWRSSPRLRSVLEHQSYSAGRYTEELVQDSIALAQALRAVTDAQR